MTRLSIGACLLVVGALCTEAAPRLYLSGRDLAKEGLLPLNLTKAEPLRREERDVAHSGDGSIPIHSLGNNMMERMTDLAEGHSREQLEDRTSQEAQENIESLQEVEGSVVSEVDSVEGSGDAAGPDTEVPKTAALETQPGLDHLFTKDENLDEIISPEDEPPTKSTIGDDNSQNNSLNGMDAVQESEEKLDASVEVMRVEEKEAGGSVEGEAEGRSMDEGDEEGSGDVEVLPTVHDPTIEDNVIEGTLEPTTATNQVEVEEAVDEEEAVEPLGAAPGNDTSTDAASEELSSEAVTESSTTETPTEPEPDEPMVEASTEGPEPSTEGLEIPTEAPEEPTTTEAAVTEDYEVGNLSSTPEPSLGPTDGGEDSSPEPTSEQTTEATTETSSEAATETSSDAATEEELTTTTEPIPEIPVELETTTEVETTSEAETSPQEDVTPAATEAPTTAEPETTTALSPAPFPDQEVETEPTESGDEETTTLEPLRAELIPKNTDSLEAVQQNAQDEVLLGSTEHKRVGAYIVVGLILLSFLSLIGYIAMKRQIKNRSKSAETSSDLKDTEKALLSLSEYKDHPDGEENNVKNNEITPVIKPNSQINKFEKNTNFSKNLNTTANEKNVEKDNVLKKASDNLTQVIIEDSKDPLEEKHAQDAEKLIVRTHLDHDSIPKKPIIVNRSSGGYTPVSHDT